VTPLSRQLRRLAKHSAIYGVGGIVSRLIAVLLLPLYTRYLTPADYGAVETVVALSAVLVTVLRLGISSAFFRFYFDEKEEAGRVRVVRTSFWFTMTMATAGLAAGLALAGPISAAFFATDDRAWLVRAAFVALWAQMNYEQLTSLFRAEERSGQFVLASLANILITVGASVAFVVGLEWGATGVVVGNFTGTLCVYAVLLAHRRYQLGLELDRALLREMNRFGLPLVPSALFLWTTNFSDRFFLVKLADAAEVGLYSIGVRVASALVLMLTAFRTAWPAFAYSIDDDAEARRTYGFVLTYLLLAASWLATALAVLSPWLVRLLTTPDFYAASRVVAPLAFGAVAFAGYVVIAIGVGRARRTQFNWVVTGAAAAVNVAVNLILIPPFGMMGAAIATLAAYTTMFAGMTWHAQRVYRVPYQWQRVGTLVAVAVALTALAKAVEAPLWLALPLALAYPLALLPLGFYLPEERSRLRRLVGRSLLAPVGRGTGSLPR
jgi:O-antigen/teichoic acid export membrane protein